MASPVLTSIGTGSATTGQTVTITTTATVAAGQSIAVFIGNRDGLTVTSVTDSASNTYVERADSATNMGGAWYDSLNPVELVSGGTITATLSASSITGAAMAAWHLGATCTYVASSAAAASGNANPSISTGASIPVDSVVLGFANRGSSTDFAPPTDWTGRYEAVVTSRRHEVHSFDVSSAGIITYDPNYSGDYAIGVTAYTSPASGNTGVLSQTIAAITLSAAGTLPIVGTLSQSIGAVALASTGALAIAGTVEQSIGSVLLSSTSALAISAALSQSIGMLTLAATGIASSSRRIVGGGMGAGRKSDEPHGLTVAEYLMELAKLRKIAKARKTPTRAAIVAVKDELAGVEEAEPPNIVPFDTRGLHTLLARVDAAIALRDARAEQQRLWAQFQRQLQAEVAAFEHQMRDEEELMVLLLSAA